MNHSFDVGLAKEVGILPAILLNSISYWIAKNEANNAEQFEGDTWTYNTVKAWTRLFPYASINQVRRAIEQLVAAGYLKTDNFNANHYDRTAWYALTDKAKSICRICQMEKAPTTKGFVPPAECTPSLSSVPDSVPSITPIAPTAAEPAEPPSNEPPPIPPPTPAERIYDIYPRKQGRKAALKAITAALKTVAAAVLEERVTAYAAAVDDWSPEQRQYVPHPATWFNRGSWEDDPETWKRRGGGNDDRFKASFA